MIVFNKHIAIFPAIEIECYFFYCRYYLFSQKVQYWYREYNTANIALFSTNQIPDIFYVSHKFSCLPESHINN